MTNLIRTFNVLLIQFSLCVGLFSFPYNSEAQDVPQLILPIGHTKSVTSVAFSPNGSHVLSGSLDETIKLWEVATGREIRSFEGHAGVVTSVAFSPDGRYILSGSEDITMKLWEVATGREIHSFEGHTDQVLLVIFSSDGSYALSSSSDNTLKYWEIATGKLLYTRFHLEEKDWVIASPDGWFNGSPGGMQLMHYAKDNKSIPLEALFDRYNTPDLVAHFLSGKTITDGPDIRNGIQMPPLVRVISPQDGETFRRQTVDVVIEAIDQGGGVEDIRLYHNDKQVSVEEREIKLVSSGQQRSFTISLMSGLNTFRATAFSRDRTEAHPFEISIQLKQ